MNVTRPSVTSTGFPSAWPVRPFSAARVNMTTAVTAAQMIPPTLGEAWCPGEGVLVTVLSRAADGRAVTAAPLFQRDQTDNPMY